MILLNHTIQWFGDDRIHILWEFLPNMEIIHILVWDGKSGGIYDYNHS